MSSCWDCGLPLPSGQGVCSMCYGDVEYGKDGYYREWLERQEESAEGLISCEWCGFLLPESRLYFTSFKSKDTCERCYDKMKSEDSTNE